MVSYLYNQKPIKNDSWISKYKINSHYTGKRNLVVAELCITNLKNFIDKIYRNGDSDE